MEDEIDNDNEQLKEQKVYNCYEDDLFYFYKIPKNYIFYSFISDEESLGPIATFIDTEAGEKDNGKLICIKKIEKPYDTCTRAKKVLKLMSILSMVNHPNIVTLKEIFIEEVDNYDSAYLFFENMPSNLERLITSNFDYMQKDPKIVPWIIYQILKGLFYIHNSNIIHRNLKPANILLDENCQVKICGFGNSVYSDSFENTLRGEINNFIIEKVGLNYQAPEVLGSKKKSKGDYDEKIDIWAVGCILAELITKESPFFMPLKIDKKRWISMLNGIFKKLGKPDKNCIESFASKERSKNIFKFKNFQKMDLKDLYHNCGDKNAIDLVEKLLCINPKQRISILEAKDHPFFDIIKDGKKSDDFVFKGQKLTFQFKNKIEQMEKENWFYNKQIDFYKENIKYLTGKYNQFEIFKTNSNKFYSDEISTAPYTIDK